MARPKTDVDFFATDIIGDGSMENPFRPRLADSTAWWWAAAQDVPKNQAIIGVPPTSPREQPYPGDKGSGPLGNGERIKQRLRDLNGENVRLYPEDPTPSGTFTDDFTGPDGEFIIDRPGWEMISGTGNGGAMVEDNMMLLLTGQGGAGSFVACTDQGSPNHYSQYVYKGTDPDDDGNNPLHGVCRGTDANNAFGCLHLDSGLHLYKRQGGGWTDLGSWPVTRTMDEVIRVWCDGDSFYVSSNGTTRIGPVNDSFNNTATRQGWIQRNSGDSSRTRMLDDYECGLVGAAVTKAFNMNISNARSPSAPGGAETYTITDPQGVGNIQES